MSCGHDAGGRPRRVHYSGLREHYWDGSCPLCFDAEGLADEARVAGFVGECPWCGGKGGRHGLFCSAPDPVVTGTREPSLTGM